MGCQPLSRVAIPHAVTQGPWLLSMPCPMSTGPPRSLASGRESESHPFLPSICLEVSTLIWLQAVESMTFWISLEEKAGLDSNAAEEPLLQQRCSLRFVPHVSKLTPVAVNSSDWWPGLLSMALSPRAPSLGEAGQQQSLCSLRAVPEWRQTDRQPWGSEM